MKKKQDYLNMGIKEIKLDDQQFEFAEIEKKLFPFGLTGGMETLRVSSFDLQEAVAKYINLRSYDIGSKKRSAQEISNNYLTGFFTYLGSRVQAKSMSWESDKSTDLGRKEIVLMFKYN